MKIKTILLSFLMASMVYSNSKASIGSTLIATASGLTASYLLPTSSQQLKITEHFVRKAVDSCVKLTKTNQVGGESTGSILNMMYILGGGANLDGQRKANIAIAGFSLFAGIATYKIVKHTLGKINSRLNP